MDEFSAQSRDDNDLFSDDFEPADHPPATLNQPTAVLTKVLSSPHVPRQPQRSQLNHRGGRGARSGLDSRRGGRSDTTPGGGLASSRYADTAPEISLPVTPHKKASSPKRVASPKPKAKTPPVKTETTTSQESRPTSSPPVTASKPTDNVTPRPHAVRGDRSATGGPAHKKLSEDEMAAKLEKMKIMDAERAERFRKSEADQAAFQQKEAELIKQREAELKNRQAMDSERAKNRERKLKSQRGREWDETKTEEVPVDRQGGKSSEFLRGARVVEINERGSESTRGRRGAVNSGRGSDYARGGHGVANNKKGKNLAASDYAPGSSSQGQQAPEGQRHRGVDSRGRFNRGGNGRHISKVEFGNNQRSTSSVAISPPAPVEFPPLPPLSELAIEMSKIPFETPPAIKTPRTPPRKPESPLLKTASSPAKATSPPLKTTSSPAEARSPPLNSGSLPGKAVSPPVKSRSPPSKATSPPVKATSPPVKGRANEWAEEMATTNK